MKNTIDENMNRIFKTGQIYPEKNSINADQDRKKNFRHHTPENHEKTDEHYDELLNAVNSANDHFVQSGSDYRFNIYREHNEIFIELVIIEQNSHTRILQKKNITHREFHEWIKHILNGEGIFCEVTG